MKRLLSAAALVCLAVFADVQTSAADSPALSPEPKKWLRWLGPLAPRGTTPTWAMTADVDPNQVWTVEKALVRALQANPDVQVALIGVERQDGLRLQAASQLLPRLGLSASFDQRSTSLIDRSAEELQRAGNPLTPLTPIADRSYTAQMEVRQILFDGLGAWHQLKRLAALEKKASVDARDLYLRVASQVRQAYDVTLTRQSIVTVRRDAVRDLTHLADVADKRFQAGEISEFESLRARSVLSSAQADLAQADADLAHAEELLCRMLYIEKPVSGLRLTGNLVPLDYKETFAVALSRARGHRLDVRSAELQLDAAKLGQRAVAAGFFPRVEAFANYAYRSSYYDYHTELDGWTIGVLGRWDIFDGGMTAGQLRAQRAERRSAEVRLAETQQLVGSQLRELFATLDQSKTVMASHAAARDLGERSVNEARKSYEAGRASLEQVLNAELSYRQALIGWLGAVYNYNTTVYQLDYATVDERFLDSLTAAR